MTGPAPLIVLWDIDGTLLRTPGVGVRAFLGAIEDVTGSAVPTGRHDLGGRTDPEIASALLAAVGSTDPALVPIVLDALVRRYELLDGELASSTQVFPGVVAAVDALTAAGAVQGVVTGNVEVAARRKLAAAGLLGHLRLDVAAFGSDHADRAELVELALSRAAAAGYEVRRERVWIVGDTPRDLACARVAGVRCLLVATGTYDMDALAAAGPDAVCADLIDTTAFIATLTVLDGLDA